MGIQNSKSALLALSLLAALPCGCSDQIQPANVAPANGQAAQQSAPLPAGVPGNQPAIQPPAGPGTGAAPPVVPSANPSVPAPAADASPMLPMPTTPMEELYVALVQCVERRVRATQSIQDVASARAAIAALREEFKNETKISGEIVRLGGRLPRDGLPADFGECYRYQQHASEGADLALEANPQYQAILVVLKEGLQDILDRRRRVAERGRRDPTIPVDRNTIVRVRIVGHDAPQGERLVRLSNYLMVQSWAITWLTLTDEDGTSTVGLEGVTDMQALIDAIDIGQVSEVNAAMRRFPLTVDPAKLPALPSDTSDAP